MTTIEDLIRKAENSEQSGKYLPAFFYYRNALVEALQKPDKANILFCKTKLVEMGKKSSSEFERFSFEQEIPPEEVKQVLKPIFEGKTITETFKLIGHYPLFSPKKKETLESAENTMPVSYHERMEMYKQIDIPLKAVNNGTVVFILLVHQNNFPKKNYLSATE